MEDLPKVFANKIDKEFYNSQNTSTVSNERSLNLDEILTKDKYSFNHKYKITLKNGQEINSSIIKITEDKILTIDNDVISIKDILNIIEIKK